MAEAESFCEHKSVRAVPKAVGMCRTAIWMSSMGAEAVDGAPHGQGPRLIGVLSGANQGESTRLGLRAYLDRPRHGNAARTEPGSIGRALTGADTISPHLQGASTAQSDHSYLLPCCPTRSARCILLFSSLSLLPPRSSSPSHSPSTANLWRAKRAVSHAFAFFVFCIATNDSTNSPKL